ncbi:MAG: GlsB/YeaQ/YmgE family stress response membrane protein [Pyrinomonadaceae bacterium]
MGLLDIIWQLIVGLIVGVLARLILPGREALPAGALGWLITAIIGVVGAFIGAMIARTLWAGENYAVGWIMSIIGAVLLLLVVRLIFGRANTATTV